MTELGRVFQKVVGSGWSIVRPNCLWNVSLIWTALIVMVVEPVKLAVTPDGRPETESWSSDPGPAELWL